MVDGWLRVKTGHESLLNFVCDPYEICMDGWDALLFTMTTRGRKDKGRRRGEERTERRERE